MGRHRGAVATAAFIGPGDRAPAWRARSREARRAEQESARATREAAEAKLERDRAVVDGQLQRGTNEFLQLVLRDSAGSNPGAIRRQLDRASELIEKTRFEQPIVKVALLRQTAARYSELGDIAAARALLERAIAATAGTDLVLPTSGVPVNLACSHARYLHEMDEQLAAIAELDRADRLIAAGAEVGVPSRVACLQPRAFAESILGHRDRAVAIGRDALRQLEGAGIRSGEQYRLMRSVLSQMLAEPPVRLAEAMAIARPLLAESTAGQGRASIAVLRRARGVVTGLTRLGGDPLAALALSQADRDDAARVLGPASEDAAFALEHGCVLLALGRATEAATILARSTDESRRTGRLVFTLWSGIAEANALVEAGDVRGAAARGPIWPRCASGRALKGGRWRSICCCWRRAWPRHAATTAPRWRCWRRPRSASMQPQALPIRWPSQLPWRAARRSSLPPHRHPPRLPSRSRPWTPRAPARWIRRDPASSARPCCCEPRSSSGPAVPMTCAATPPRRRASCRRPWARRIRRPALPPDWPPKCEMRGLAGPSSSPRSRTPRVAALRGRFRFSRQGGSRDTRPQ